MSKHKHPAITMEYLQTTASETPRARIKPASTGMPRRLAPPPSLPHPADVAFAVPTTLVANISDVCTWVITHEAPMKLVKNRQIKNWAGVWAKPVKITGTDPSNNSPV